MFIIFGYEMIRKPKYLWKLSNPFWYVYDVLVYRFRLFLNPFFFFLSLI